MFHLEKSSKNIQHVDAILTYNLFFSAPIASEYIGKTHSNYIFGRHIRVHFIYLGHRHGLHILFQAENLLRRQFVPMLPEHTLSEQVRTAAQELPSGSTSQ